MDEETPCSLVEHYPNAETQKALIASRSGDGEIFDSIKELWKSLKFESGEKEEIT